MKLFDFSCEVT